MPLTRGRLEGLLQELGRLSSEARSDLIARHIVADPHRPGPADAMLKDAGVSVWAVINYLDAADGNLRQVSDDYDLPLEAIAAAITYYERHKPEIDARIAVHGSLYSDQSAPDVC